MDWRIRVAETGRRMQAMNLRGWRDLGRGSVVVVLEEGGGEFDRSVSRIPERIAVPSVPVINEGLEMTHKHISSK